MKGSGRFSWNAIDTDTTIVWTALGFFASWVWPPLHDWLLSFGGWWPPIVAGAIVGAWTAAKRYLWNNPDPKFF